MSSRLSLQMLAIRRQAAQAHCRITRWKLTHEQAWALADETFFDNCQESIYQQVQRMRRGEAHMLGAQIMVKP
jgi:hypothetical protein